MARTINQIYTGLVVGLQNAANAVGLSIFPNNWSKYDYKKLSLSVVSEAHAIQEQLHDSLIEDTENIASRLPPSTAQYIQHMMKNVFEYDAVTIPIVQLSSEFVPYYPNPNPNQRIVKYCSVNKSTAGVVIVKIAGVGPSIITGTAVSAANTFINLTGVPSISYTVISNNADKLYIEADIYFNGLYAAVIQSSVTTGIENYLKSIDFNGKISILEIEIAIKSVQGVNDVVIKNMNARTDSQTILLGTDLVLNQTTVNKDFQTFAGYIVPETTPLYTLADRLNLIPQ